MGRALTLRYTGRWIGGVSGVKSTCSEVLCVSARSAAADSGAESRRWSGDERIRRIGSTRGRAGRGDDASDQDAIDSAVKSDIKVVKPRSRVHYVIYCTVIPRQRHRTASDARSARPEKVSEWAGASGGLLGSRLRDARPGPPPRSKPFFCSCPLRFDEKDLSGAALG